jgi:hypothetical protein
VAEISSITANGRISRLDVTMFPLHVSDDFTSIFANVYSYYCIDDDVQTDQSSFTRLFVGSDITVDEPIAKCERDGCTQAGRNVVYANQPNLLSLSAW